MSYGILISNNVGLRKGVPVFDSRNPDCTMLQPILAFDVIAGSSGSAEIVLPVATKSITNLGLTVYPLSDVGDLPDVWIENGYVFWDYGDTTNPTAVNIVVLT